MENYASAGVCHGTPTSQSSHSQKKSSETTKFRDYTVNRKYQLFLSIIKAKRIVYYRK